MYLAAAGIGHLIIADFDQVELSNLQRQVIHYTDDIGKDKVKSAKVKMLIFWRNKVSFQLLSKGNNSC
jgi:adenylyltransferase/sulfurtransferase